jgi:hypothetical protein
MNVERLVRLITKSAPDIPQDASLRSLRDMTSAFSKSYQQNSSKLSTASSESATVPFINWMLIEEQQEE